MEDFVVGSGIAIAYYLTIIGFIIMGLSFVLGTAMDLKKSLPFVIGILVMVGLFFAFYSSQGGEIPSYVSQAKIAKDGLTGGVMKFVSAGIILSLILTVGAFVFMLLDMVVSFFK